MPGRVETLSTFLFALCFCFLAGSCDHDFLSEDGGSDGAGSVALHFPTTVDKLSTIAGTRAFVSGGLIEGTTFPVGDNEIGMFITKNTSVGGALFPGSSDNMKAVLKRNAAGIETWNYYQKGSTDEITPAGDVGKNIKMLAYYPYNGSTTVAGVPFDFTGDVNTNPQHELLYNKEANQGVKIPDNGDIPLKFAHAYSRITLKIRKNVASGTIVVDQTSIVNITGRWIKNKGNINLSTGYPANDAVTGEIYDNKKMTLSATGDSPYDFLVPAFMDEAVKSGDVGFQLLVDGKSVVFTLDQTELNRSDDGGSTKYGFGRGYHNTYHLVYDNLSMSLQLRKWTVVTPEGNIGVPVMPESDYAGWYFDYADIASTVLDTLSSNIRDKTPIKDHAYETYLTDLDRGNNGNSAAFWLPGQSQKLAFGFVWSVEPPRSPIEFALKDVLPTPVEWRTETGVITAKQLCKDYREGGFTNWRLPRMTEWYMFAMVNQSKSDYLYFPQVHGGEIPSGNVYWSGTESFNSSSVQTIRLHINQSSVWITGDVLSPASKALVRCVRDADPKTN